MRAARFAIVVWLLAVPLARALDASAMAPLSEKEFFSFFDAYRAFADCVDTLAQKSGLNGNAVGKALSKSGKAEDLIAQAEKILAPNSSFHAQIRSAQVDESQRVQLAIAALLDQARTNDPSVNQTRHIVSMAMTRLFVAQASDGSCGPSNEFMTLFDKARKQ